LLQVPVLIENERGIPRTTAIKHKIVLHVFLLTMQNLERQKTGDDANPEIVPTGENLNDKNLAMEPDEGFLQELTKYFCQEDIPNERIK
jgi:hypothetical protein